MPKSRPSNSADTPRFLNRELSWLEFNQRVLGEALDPRVPLLERLKFYCITHSNLDEFFEVRVAGLKQQIEADVLERSPDGLTPSETYSVVLRRARQLTEQASACWRELLVPALAEAGIRFLKPDELDDSGRAWVESYYAREVQPVLTPLAFDPAHPFPHLINKALNLVVRLFEERDGQRHSRIAFVQVPRVLPLLVKRPGTGSRHDYVFLAQVIARHLADIFHGTTIEGCWAIRVTRNGELYIDEEDASNLLKAVENELHNRRRGEAVRLEVETDCPLDIRAFLLEQLRLREEDLFVVDGPIHPTRLLSLVGEIPAPEHHDPPFVAPIAEALRTRDDPFTAIRQGDILLHHPYESFESVVQFLQTAADDPAVLAIKQTLYRTGGDARIVGALMNAAKNGKQATAVVELKARFDEANNIQWARRLEDAGVHVVYGLVGYKIHCKAALVVRRDDDGIRRYVHLATGNYNASTAKLYTDLGLLSCRPELGEDVTQLFNLLTGICQFRKPQRLLVAPFDLHRRVIELVNREAEHARRGLSARIILKLNSLVDVEAIEALYKASQAGVEIDLIVRGICCLRPGIPGVSDRIRVRSIIDRFLEHSRIYYFENARRPEVYIASADWMPRNFFRRIEVAFPLEDGRHVARVIDEILRTSLADTAKAHLLQADGGYCRAGTQGPASGLRSQSEFMARATATRQAPTTGRSGTKFRLRPRPAAPH